MIIFFDGNCPLCLREMCSLKRHDTKNQIELIDVQDDKAMEMYPDIDKSHALSVLHGIKDGKRLYGLDVTVAAWCLVGKHRWLRLSRLPIIKTLSDRFYLFFAKHRMKISSYLYKDQCANNVCGNKKP